MYERKGQTGLFFFFKKKSNIFITVLNNKTEF